MKKELLVNDKECDLRIDKYLALKEPKFSRVFFANLIKEGNVTINGKIVSPSYKICPNDSIIYDIKHKEFDTDITPTKMNIDIIYEDDDILIINKPQGLVVHPGDGHHDDTLVNGLIYLNKELSDVNGLERVGIVHRIDKDTSGLLLVCKNDFAHNFIADQLKNHTMHREYIALVCGNIQEDNGKIIAPLARSKTNRLKFCVDPVNGKSAITHFKVLKRFSKYTLLECKLETGRTHQIRVHMEYINHPVVGDPLYGENNCFLYNKGQLLHAYKLTFIHPTTKKEVSFECPLPKYFKDIIDNLN
ncbi:MAG: RluA family pseudouridine synthase [Bacilli bacterium]